MLVTAPRLALLSAVLALVGVGSLVLAVVSRALVLSVARRQGLLTPGTEASEKFARPPVPFYQRVYVFNLTNYDEVLNGTSPRVEELGPYVFRIEPSKTMRWSNGRLHFNSKKNFFFEPQMSNGTLKDEVVTVNPFILTVIGMSFMFPPDQYERLMTNRTVFFSTSVGALLYDGFEEPLLDLVDIESPKNEGRIGILVGTNDTEEGEFSVFSGKDDPRRLNNIISFLGKTTNPVYDDGVCNTLEGTNGEMFPPFTLPPSNVKLFNPLLCRPWPLYYSGPVDLDGLEVARYKTGNDFLSLTGDEDLDACYQPKEVMPRGTFDASACQKGVPAVLSMPHFLNGDPQLTQKVHGLNPQPDRHEFYIDVYPRLGFSVDMRVRMQVNFKLQGGPNDPDLPEVIYPVIWQEMALEARDRRSVTGLLLSKVESMPFKLAVASGVVGGVFLLLAASAVAYAVFFLVTERGSGRQHINPEQTNARDHAKVSRQQYSQQHSSVAFSSRRQEVRVERSQNSQRS